MTSQLSEEPSARLIRLGVVTVVVGVLSGLGGMTLALLLRLIQHLSYRYQLSPILGEQSFLHGVSAASPQRRVAVLVLCGLIAGVGWWLVYRFLKPIVSIRQAVAAPEKPMPVTSTIAHVLLQIVTVAMGSPLGREVAPRELGALLAGRLARGLRLGPADVKVMIACGAGAGLAAVYNVPLAGAVFTLEVLLGSFSLSLAVPAFATSVIAAIVAWLGLGNRSQYLLPDLHISTGLVVWAIVFGPLFGYAGLCYARLAVAARRRAPRDARLMPMALAVFACIGVAAIWYPELLGNGRGPMQLALDNEVPVALALPLLALKLLATSAALWAGAEGGLLTPGLTVGALLATLLGAGCNQLLGLAIEPAGYAIVGATALLASSMAMPVTAVVLILEFTRVDHDFLYPLLFAVAGSMATRYFVESRAKGR